MKKYILPVMIIVLLFILSCEPELAQKEKLDDPDLILEGGRVAFYFDEPRLELGKTYIVTFDMTDCDESFLGNRMGGKLSYALPALPNRDKDVFTEEITSEGLLISPTRASEEYHIVAGWDYCMPNVILDRPMRYKWTFTVGQQQRDNKPLFKDKDDVIESGWDTMPEDATQFFLLIAQTLGWKNFGSFTQFGVMLGNNISDLGFSIVEKVMPEGTLTKLADITIDEKNATTGSGTIRTDYTKLPSALANDKYAFLRFYMKGCSFNPQEIEERTGVAAVGNLDNIRAANPNAFVMVPAGGTPRPAGTADEDFSEVIPTRGGTGINFFVDLDIEDLLLFRKTNENYLNVNVSRGRLDRIELYTYQK